MKRISLLLLTFTLFCLPMMAQQNDSTAQNVVQPKQEMTQAEKDSIVYSKLSPDQIMSLKEQELQLESEKLEAHSKLDMPLNGFGIVMIVFAPFIFVILLIFFNNKQRDKESKRKYELYLKSLEMGQSIPDSFFKEPEVKSKSSNLKKGVLLLMVGLALIIVSFVRQDLHSGLFIGGIIPGLLGIGYILVHILEKPKKTDETPEVKDEQNG
jgi:hypothetical protein